MTKKNWKRNLLYLDRIEISILFFWNIKWKAVELASAFTSRKGENAKHNAPNKKIYNA